MNKKPEELAEIQNLPVAELVERLDGLTATDLSALRALETAGGDGRKGALAAIDAATAKLTPPADPEGDAPDANITVDSDLPAWQLPSYSGPLDIEQAAWRNANISTKPVRGASTK